MRCAEAVALAVEDGNVRGCVGLDQNRAALRAHIHVAQVSLRALQKIAVAENAVHAQEILILQIAAAAPFEHLDAQTVHPAPDIVRQVELGLQMTSLREADGLPVDLYKGAGGHTL